MAGVKIKQITGFKGYFATESGEIMRLDENGGKILQAYKDRNGYLRVNFGKRFYLVHRLVATAFLSNPDGLPCINHIDGNPLNNAVVNLEWCTYAYNNAHKVHKTKRKQKKHIGFVQIKGDKLVKRYTSFSELAAEYSKNCVSKALRGVRKSYKGFLWIYAANFYKQQNEFDF